MPFKKGQSGNPKGAPKKEYSFTKCFSEAVDKLEVDYKDEKLKGKEVIVQAYIDLAFNTKYPPAIRQRALDTIVERIDGKAQQNINMNGEMTTNTESIIDMLGYRDMTSEQKEHLKKALENKGNGK